MNPPDHAPPVLDWKPQHDPRSLDYPVRTLIGPERVVTERRRTWKAGPVLDQGSEGACVGFGWTGAMLAAPRRLSEPVSATQGAVYALAAYGLAKVLDAFPGEDYSGTSVLAGAQAMQQWGLITSYRWCFGVDDVRDALITEGPVVIGIPWYESMYGTDEHGEVVVDGDMVGGHCIVLTGFDPSHDGFGGRAMFRWRNSWGKVYGNDGNAWIGLDALGALLDDDGEACVPSGPRAVTLTQTLTA